MMRGSIVGELCAGRNKRTPDTDDFIYHVLVYS